MTFFREDGRCVEKKVVAEKTELPAEFKINCECWAPGPLRRPHCWLRGRAAGSALHPRGPGHENSDTTLSASSHCPSRLQCCGHVPAGLSDPHGDETRLAVCGHLHTPPSILLPSCQDAPRRQASPGPFPPRPSCAHSRIPHEIQDETARGGTTSSMAAPMAGVWGDVGCCGGWGLHGTALSGPSAVGCPGVGTGWQSPYP